MCHKMEIILSETACQAWFEDQTFDNRRLHLVNKSWINGDDIGTVKRTGCVFRCDVAFHRDQISTVIQMQNDHRIWLICKFIL